MPLKERRLHMLSSLIVSIWFTPDHDLFFLIHVLDVRETLRGQDLSFTEIAKVVGERWQLLPQAEREGFERQAALEKERYYAQLAEYKKTPEYAQYQEYLVEFKAKHAVPRRGQLIWFCTIIYDYAELDRTDANSRWQTDQIGSPGGDSC